MREGVEQRDDVESRVLTQSEHVHGREIGEKIQPYSWLIFEEEANGPPVFVLDVNRRLVAETDRVDNGVGEGGAKSDEGWMDFDVFGEPPVARRRRARVEKGGLQTVDVAHWRRV